MAATREASAPGAPDVEPPEALYRKLRPGPGRSAGEVALHQKARLRGSMVQLVAERGYDAVTVRGLATLAGVSTRTVYEHFDSKEACLLAVLGEVVQCAASRALQDKESQGREQLRALLVSLSEELKRNPELGRVVLLEALAAGPAALRKLRNAEQAFGGLLVESFEGTAGNEEVPSLVVEGIVSGLVGIARTRLLDGREAELPVLVDELLDWTFCYPSETAAALTAPDLRVAPALSVLGSNASPTDANGRTPGDERALILSAVAKLAAAEGYPELTIPRIRAVAGVSRRSFDASFESVEDCFAAALELHAAHAIVLSTSAYAEVDNWTEGVHLGITALCEYIACDPVLATLGFVEIFSLGPEGVRVRERLMARVGELFHDSAPLEHRPSELVAEASVAAVWGVLHRYVVAGQAQLLPSIAPALSYIALAPAIGAKAAVDAIRQGAISAAETSTSDRKPGRGAS